jgi:hypothetical protein
MLQQQTQVQAEAAELLLLLPMALVVQVVQVLLSCVI